VKEERKNRRRIRRGKNWREKRTCGRIEET
jgi:hypothetical protein